MSSYSRTRRANVALSPDRPSPDTVPCSPPNDRGVAAEEEDSDMRIARRVVIALSSVIALALAGGAHWKVS
jgi:hypothetical protein